MDAIQLFLRQLGSVGKHGNTLSNVVVYVLVTFPRRAYEFFGYAALIGGLLGLGGLAGAGELTALRAAGMSRLRIAGSAVGVVAVLIVGVVIIGETLAPWGDQQAQVMQLRMKSGNLGMGTESGLWARDGNSIINARGTSLKQHDGVGTVQLSDVRVFTFANDGQLRRFEWAKTAEHNGREWVLQGVRSTTLDEKGTHTTLIASQPWQSSLNPQVLAQSVIQPQYLSMRDLRRNMNYLESNGESAGSYAVAFWGRALYPFNVLVLVLCAMPFAFGSLRSGGLGKRMFIGILLALGWHFLQQAMVNFGTVYGRPPLLANLLPALILVFAAWLYFRRRA
jgi:lipopolysaccharide export system permease protein